MSEAAPAGVVPRAEGGLHAMAVYIKTHADFASRLGVVRDSTKGDSTTLDGDLLSHLEALTGRLFLLRSSRLSPPLPLKEPISVGSEVGRSLSEGSLSLCQVTARDAYCRGPPSPPELPPPQMPPLLRPPSKPMPPLLRKMPMPNMLRSLPLTPHGKNASKLTEIKLAPRKSSLLLTVTKLNTGKVELPLTAPLVTNPQSNANSVKNHSKSLETVICHGSLLDPSSDSSALLVPSSATAKIRDLMKSDQDDVLRHIISNLNPLNLTIIH